MEMALGRTYSLPYTLKHIVGGRIAVNRDTWAMHVTWTYTLEHACDRTSYAHTTCKSYVTGRIYSRRH